MAPFCTPVQCQSVGSTRGWLHSVSGAGEAFLSFPLLLALINSLSVYLFSVHIL